MKKMKNLKGITIPLLTAVLLLGSSSYALALETIRPISVAIDSMVQQYSTAPIIERDRVLVPMNAIFTSLEAVVEWDGENRVVTAKKGDDTVIVRLDSYFATVNGETVQMDVKPVIVEGRTMVPLAFVSRALGAKAEWDAFHRVVHITTPTEDEVVEGADEPDTKEQTRNNAEIDQSRRTLTYEEATNRAIQQSNTLKNRKESREQLEIYRERAGWDLSAARPQDPTDIVADIQAKQALLGVVQTDINLQMARKQEELEKENIEFEVKNTFNQIIELEDQIHLTQLMLENQETKMKLMEVRAEHGTESKFNFDEIRRNYAQQEKQMEMLEKSLDNAYLFLNMMIGASEDSRYQLEKGNSNFEPLEDMNLDAFIRGKMNNDPYIWLQEQQITAAERDLQLYVFTGRDTPYAVRQSNVRQEKNNLSEIKRKYEETLKSRYNQLSQLETQFEVEEMKLEQAEERLRLLRLQYDLGMIISADLEDAQLGMTNTKYELDKLVRQYDQLKTIFEKPYLAPEYLR